MQLNCAIEVGFQSSVFLFRFSICLKQSIFDVSLVDVVYRVEIQLRKPYENPNILSFSSSDEDRDETWHHTLGALQA